MRFALASAPRSLTRASVPSTRFCPLTPGQSSINYIVLQPSNRRQISRTRQFHRMSRWKRFSSFVKIESVTSSTCRCFDVWSKSIVFTYNVILILWREVRRYRRHPFDQRNRAYDRVLSIPSYPGRLLPRVNRTR